MEMEGRALGSYAVPVVGEVGHPEALEPGSPPCCVDGISAAVCEGHISLMYPGKLNGTQSRLCCILVQV